MRKYDITAEDAQKLRALAELDEQTFSALLSSVLSALGASRNQAAMMRSNSGAIRSMLSTASDSDIRRLAQRLGPRKTGEILDIIGGGSVDGEENT